MNRAAARTSIGPMMIAAVETRRPPKDRLLTDDRAIEVLPPALRLMVRGGVLGGWVERLIDRQTPGVWNVLACRKRYFDDLTSTVIDEGIEALVVLGAGLDTKACRLTSPAGIPAFEVDQPVNIDLKRDRITLPANVTAVPIDFETEELATVLTDHGYDPKAKTLFLWEGVTQYLTEPAVRATFTTLSSAAPGSVLGFSFVQQDFLDGTNHYGSSSSHKRFVGGGLWRYGIHPGKVGELLAEYGWREREQVGAHEHLTRYLRPIGRAGVSDIERCVRAEKI